MGMERLGADGLKPSSSMPLASARRMPCLCMAVRGTEQDWLCTGGAPARCPAGLRLAMTAAAATESDVRACRRGGTRPLLIARGTEVPKRGDHRQISAWPGRAADRRCRCRHRLLASEGE